MSEPLEKDQKSEVRSQKSEDSERNETTAGPTSSTAKRRRWVLYLAVVVLGGLAGFVVWFFAIRVPEPQNDFERFQGDWSISVGEREGVNALRVSGDRWEYVGGKAYRMTLNETTNPKEIDLEPLDLPKMIGPPPRLHGVYSFENNATARLLLVAATQPRPTSLDDTEFVQTLRKVKFVDPPSEPGR